MKTDPIMQFKEEVRQRMSQNANNAALCKSAAAFMLESTEPKYSYNFEWLGRPIIQYPQDIVAME
jgi:cephalosporin hydroxylase